MYASKEFNNRTDLCKRACLKFFGGHQLFFCKMVFPYPLPLGWWGWMEAFCSYILRNGWKWPQNALQNQYPFKTHQNPKVPPLYKMTVPNRTFLAHFRQEPILQNDNPLNTSISLTFAPIGFETQNQNKSHFVDMNLCNPICPMSLTMALGLLALQNGKPMFFPNSHLYKMANPGGWQTTIAVTSRPFTSF